MMGDFFDFFGEGTRGAEIVRLPACCPKCGSSRCQLQATGRKTGVIVGGVLGTVIAAGFRGAKMGAVRGASIAVVIGRQPPLTIAGTISGALVGFFWGAIAGHAVGAEIDGKVILVFTLCSAAVR